MTVNSRFWAARTRASSVSSEIHVVRPVPDMAAPLSGVGAVEALTRALAVEFAPARLRLNTVRFGRIDIPLRRSRPGLDSDEAMAAAGSTTPLGRFGAAQEAAASVLFLMADNYVTGQIITVDGGETLT